MRIWMVVLLTVAGFANVVFAETTYRLNMTLDEFRSFHDRLARDIDTAGFADLSSGERELIRIQQSIIRKKIRNHHRLEDMHEDDVVSVFNSHQHIVAILDDAEDSRMICERRRPVGSNLKRLECATKRARDAMRENSQEDLRRQKAH